MSTGADCRFTETKKGRWFYELQQWPYGETPDYDVYGPFSSFEAAERHLSDNHANPGGYTCWDWTEARGDRPDPEGAIKPRRTWPNSSRRP